MWGPPGITPQFLLEVPPFPQPVGSLGACNLGKNDNPLPRKKSGMPKNWTLPLIESCPMIGILRLFSARHSVVNYPVVPATTSTCASGWTSQVMLSKLMHHILWIWGSRTSKDRMNLVSSVLLLPGLEGQRMYPSDPIGWRRIMSLSKQQLSERVGQGQTRNIAIKLFLKFGGKIRNLSAKIFWWVDHLFTGLLLVQTRQTQKHHNQTQLLFKKNQNPRHWLYKWNRENESEKCMYQRTRSQTHHCQTNHQANMILLMTSSKSNIRARDAI